tara:strand:- start:34 stop:1515 length:1482 start_codon:yes stop_codon:yes gene_type:complete
MFRRVQNVRVRVEWPDPIQRIAMLVGTAGGTTRAVGGTVIDILMHGEPKDWDLEVYGVEPDDLYMRLYEFTPTICGKSFGIFKIQSDGLDIDVSIPRRDSSTGNGHRDFEVDLDPSMDPADAARRRDFTINTLSIKIPTQKKLDHYGDARPDFHRVHDHFGGVEDFLNGTLRVTCEDTFREDPLRGFRAMQISARKAPHVTPETIKIIKSMNPLDLPRERCMGEFEKLLLLADQPSIGLNFLKECGWLRFFPELYDMADWIGWQRDDNAQWMDRFDEGCPQNPEWHPEGNVWVHTLLVVDAAAQQREQVDPEWRLAFMFAALLHDVAKPITTELPKCTAYGHETAGGPLTRGFMGRLTNDITLTNRVVKLVENHLQPHFLKEARPSRWKRLQDRVERLDVLGHLTIADWCGRPGRNPEEKRHVGTTAMCFHWHEKFGEKSDKVVPVVTGYDLIDRGFKPGPLFKVALQAALDAQLDGENDKNTLLRIAITGTK